MDDKKENLAKEVSDFFHKSCQRPPAHHKNPVFEFEHLGNELSDWLHKYYRHPTECHSAVSSCRGHSFIVDHPVDCSKCRVFPTQTGSAAEFYITPLLPCIGDRDIMYHYNNELAIPAGHPPPTQLPSEFHTRIRVFEIVDSHIPGYVYLALTYILSRSNDKYKIAHYVNSCNSLLSHDLYITAGVNLSEVPKAEIHGPSCTAQCHIGRDTVDIEMCVDTVPCVRCLIWPNREWPTRHRNYDWPDQATVDCVVSKGCDIVGVSHTLCKQHEWESKHQWRLSFSRAEVVLLNNWMPIQQIVYHMLRTFMKVQRLTFRTSNDGKSSFSNYHIKTLMLWACEAKPLSWWNCASNLVNLCLQVIRFLEEWLTVRRGQHYFINNVHFLDYLDTSTVNTLTAVLKSTKEDSLAQWFVENYIRKCAELCPDNFSVMCSGVVTREKLNAIATRILRWKDYVSGNLLTKFCHNSYSEIHVPIFRSWVQQPVDLLRVVINSQFNVGMSSILHLAVQRNFEKRFLGDFVKIAGEHRPTLKREFVDMLAFVISAMSCSREQRRRIRYSSSKCNNVSALGKATIWMKMVAEIHPVSHEVAHIELAKLYLRLALRCEDCAINSVFCIANVYLAVLCFITGQYQKAADHCRLVTRSQIYTECNTQKSIVQGELLPKIDDDIDAVLGLAALYKYLKTTALDQSKKSQHASVFTAELFAHFVNIRCLLVAKCRLAPKVHEKHVLQLVEYDLHAELKLLFKTLSSTPHLFVSDLMLCKLPNYSHRRLTSNSSTDTVTSGSPSNEQLVEFLTQSSIEQMLTCRQFMVTEYTDPKLTAIVKTMDFTPLCLFRLKLYERCIHQCERIVREITDSYIRSTEHLSFTCREFINFMDDDIVSLTGIMVLLDKFIIQSNFKVSITISSLVVALYLLIQCRKRYLILRISPSWLDVAPVADVLDWVGKAQKMIPADNVLDQLILKLTERVAVVCITDTINNDSS